jgi:hypothetical protein
MKTAGKEVGRRTKKLVRTSKKGSGKGGRKKRASQTSPHKPPKIELPRVPKAFMLKLSEGSIVVGEPRIKRIICDPLHPDAKEPAFDWHLNELEVFGAPSSFRLDEYGRLFTTSNGEGEQQWQLRMALTPRWPPKHVPRQGREGTEVTLYFAPVPMTILLVTEADLHRMKGQPPVLE